MTKKVSSGSAAQSPPRDYYYGNPTCEYCGHQIFPGEEEAVDHEFLCWHKDRCFRCYGCHREFNRDRRCNLLDTMALCDDCYPRHEFLEDEWYSLNHHAAPYSRQPRVCFLAPLIRKERPREHSMYESPMSANGSANEEIVDCHSASGQTTTSKTKNIGGNARVNLFRKTDEIPALTKRAPFPEKVTASQGELIDVLPAADRATIEKDASVRTPEKSVEVQIAEAIANVEPVTATEMIPNLMEIEDEVPNQGFENVPAQDGSLDASSQDDPEAEVSIQVFGTDSLTNDDEADNLEKVMVDDKLMVVAVKEWDEVVKRVVTGTEYTEEIPSVGIDKIGNSYRDHQRPTSAFGMRTEMEEPVDEDRGTSSLPFRRTKSYSELYKFSTSSLPTNFFPHNTRGSNHSESLVEFNPDVKSTGGDKEGADVARHMGPCHTPSPQPQSSTPIPLNAQGVIDNERPPSAFRDDKAWTRIGHSSTRTISPQDMSVEQEDDDMELPSFQERRAFFQFSNQSERNAICCTCKERLYSHERFDCLHQSYHIRCFLCTRCKARLNSKSFCDDGKNPYCKTCFKDMKVSKNHFLMSPLRKRVNSM